MTIFNDEESDQLMAHLRNAPDLEAAMKEIRSDRQQIESEDAYLKTIFVHDVNWYCEKFKIKLSNKH